MGFTNVIETVNMDGMTDFERIDQNLRSLLVSTVGMIPGSRGFGLTDSFISANPEYAVSRLAEELDEKCETYIPEISIAEVEYDMDDNGVATLKIYAERRVEE